MANSLNGSQFYLTRGEHAMQRVNIHWSLDESELKKLQFGIWLAPFNMLSFHLYHRYASLYFVAAIENSDNELITLEIIHRYVELLDKYFGSVSIYGLTFEEPDWAVNIDIFIL
jgi:hypothetical protein